MVIVLAGPSCLKPHLPPSRSDRASVSTGADTTKIALTAFLRYIYETPEALAKMRAEIEEAVSKGELDLPPSWAQASKLVYTQAAVKCALKTIDVAASSAWLTWWTDLVEKRCASTPVSACHFVRFPSLPPQWRSLTITRWPLERVVPEGGRVIGGQYFPAGTLVGQSAWTVHYDERAFGKDAAVFRPERWLEGERNDLERYNLTVGGSLLLSHEQKAYLVRYARSLALALEDVVSAASIPYLAEGRLTLRAHSREEHLAHGDAQAPSDPGSPIRP